MNFSIRDRNRDIGGTLRIFAEYMEGGTLAEALEQEKAKTWDDIAGYGLQCLEGLAFAHEKGLADRDVKPANCL